MFDPLSSGGFEDDDANDAPPWPTTPHPPNSPIPGNLRRASTPVPSQAPDSATAFKGPSLGPFGQEAQIYGQPESGLISPRDAVAPNGKHYEKSEPYLRVRITGLDRNRRDILVKLDAQTNLSNFTGNTYRNVSRSYLEFQQFYDAIIHNNPQTIVPALPLAQTSAPTDEEDDRLVRIMLQRWITRVCEDPIMQGDEDVRAFIENDFGFQPTPRPRRKASSGFAIMRKAVPDEDEDLQRARFELTKLEGQFFDTAKSVDKLSLARKSLAVAHAEMGNKLINIATTEAHPPLGNAFRKIGRGWHSLADLDQAQGISECVILGDSLGYQGMNARSAKETLLMRTGVLEEYQAAVKSTISKRRQIERLKASSNIRPERVDEALDEIEEANKYEQTLARRAQGISQNLHQALESHNRYANDDITTALIEHARSSIMYERQLLRELEALRVDVSKAADAYVPPTNGAPKVPVIPGLEESLKPTPARTTVAPPAAAAPPASAFVPRPPSVIAPIAAASAPPGATDPLSNGSSFLPGQQNIPPRIATPQRAPFQSFGRSLTVSQPYSSNPLGSPGPPSASSTKGLYDRREIVTPSSSQSSLPYHPSPAQSPVPPPSNEPPLGGRLVEPSKSMFIKPPSAANPSLQPSISSPLVPSPVTPNGPSGGSDPLSASGSSFVQSRGPQNGRSSALGSNPLQNGLDPLGQMQPVAVSATVRTPQRPRLDARDAAKSLANMF